MALLFLTVGVNVFVMTIFGHHFNSGQNIKKVTEGVSIVLRPIHAERGKIKDRNGNIIAQDVTTYTLDAKLDTTRFNGDKTPAHVVDKEATADAISEIVGIDRADVMAQLNSTSLQVEFGQKGKYITADQKAALEETKLPGLGFTPIIARIYPNNEFASELIGFAKYDESENVRNIKGQIGIEAYYDNYLLGKNGSETFPKTAGGYFIDDKQVIREEPKNGSDIKLTLDRSIQDALSQALHGMLEDPKVRAEKAWGIVVEADTGKILGWGQAPSFDPNVLDISEYLNYVSQSTYEPGSTMKTFTVAAAIEEGVWPDEQSFYSGPFYVGVKDGKGIRLPSPTGSIHTITNAQNINYGDISYNYGYVQSSNVMISELLTSHLDPLKFKEYKHKLGFHKVVGTDLVPESEGVEVPERPLELITDGFGQGSTVTMLQMAQAYTSIMTDGTMVKPYVVESISDPQTGQVQYEGKTEKIGKIFKDSTSKKMRDLMRDVVAPGGSAMRFEVEETEVIAKTGTAQKVENGIYSPTDYIFSSVVGFPHDNPKYIVYTAYEAKMGHSIDASAVYVKDIVKKVVATDKYTQVGGGDVEQIKTDYVMNVVNYDVESATNNLKEKGYQPVVIGQGNTVISQVPSSKQQVISNERILLLTNGESITVPDFTGWSRKEMTNFWAITGIQVEISGSGFVKDQSIPAGSVITKDQVISVNLR